MKSMQCVQTVPLLFAFVRNLPAALPSSLKCSTLMGLSWQQHWVSVTGFATITPQEQKSTKVSKRCHPLCLPEPPPTAPAALLTDGAHARLWPSRPVFPEIFFGVKRCIGASQARITCTMLGMTSKTVAILQRPALTNPPSPPWSPPRSRRPPCPPPRPPPPPRAPQSP